MTTIAVSQTEMSADSSLDLRDGIKNFTQKIHFTPFGIAAGSGYSEECNIFLDFLKGDIDKSQIYPMINFRGVLLNDSGITLFDSRLNATRIESDIFAIGSGAQAALAAMHCGKGTREAVEIASRIDADTSLPVQCVALKDWRHVNARD